MDQGFQKKNSQPAAREKYPHMRTFKPRRSSKTLRMERQRLMDLEHRLSADIGSFLVLLEQGTPHQIAEASQKARSDFMKVGSDMQKLATEIGGTLPKHVSEFLASIDHILHTGINWLDQNKINACYAATQKLENALRPRSKQ